MNQIKNIVIFVFGYLLLTKGFSQNKNLTILLRDYEGNYLQDLVVLINGKEIKAESSGGPEAYARYSSSVQNEKIRLQVSSSMYSSIDTTLTLAQLEHRFDISHFYYFRKYLTKLGEPIIKDPERKQRIFKLNLYNKDGGNLENANVIINEKVVDLKNFILKPEDEMSFTQFYFSNFDTLPLHINIHYGNYLSIDTIINFSDKTPIINGWGFKTFTQELNFFEKQDSYYYNEKGHRRVCYPNDKMLSIIIKLDSGKVKKTFVLHEIEKELKQLEINTKIKVIYSPLEDETNVEGIYDNTFVIYIDTKSNTEFNKIASIISHHPDVITVGTTISHHKNYSNSKPYPIHLDLSIKYSYDDSPESVKKLLEKYGIKAIKDVEESIYGTYHILFYDSLISETNKNIELIHKIPNQINVIPKVDYLDTVPFKYEPQPIPIIEMDVKSK